MSRGFAVAISLILSASAGGNLYQWAVKRKDNQTIQKQGAMLVDVALIAYRSEAQLEQCRKQKTWTAEYAP